MKSFIYALVTVLLCGVRLTDSSSMTANLFIHYLMGSGESVTLHSPELLRLCDKEGVVNAYGTQYENAVGSFTCRGDGSAWDLYDFTCIGKVRDPLLICMAQYLPSVDTDLDLDRMGRCLVRTGVGRLFHVEIRG
jgi:hypothetical protein